jgi:hypothetical protein
MSPVSFCRYRVVFIDGSVFEVFVAADGRAQALAEAKTIYMAGGLTGFSVVNHDAEWNVEELQS